LAQAVSLPGPPSSPRGCQAYSPQSRALLASHQRPKSSVRVLIQARQICHYSVRLLRPARLGLRDTLRARRAQRSRQSVQPMPKKPARRCRAAAGSSAGAELTDPSGIDSPRRQGLSSGRLPSPAFVFHANEGLAVPATSSCRVPPVSRTARLLAAAAAGGGLPGDGRQVPRTRLRRHSGHKVPPPITPGTCCRPGTGTESTHTVPGIRRNAALPGSWGSERN
jgi:hypothetical protein